MARRPFLEIVYALSLLLPAASWADQEPPDAEFLEFLGSWEEDEDWLDLMEVAQQEKLEKGRDFYVVICCAHIII